MNWLTRCFFSDPSQTQSRKRRIRAQVAQVEVVEQRVLLTGSAPDFNPNSFSFTVAENASTVGTLTATDADQDLYAWHLSGPGSEKFSIDNSGLITVFEMLDYETSSSYSLTATVWDMEGNYDVAAVTINVTDVAEDPEFTALPFIFAVDEDAQSGTLVGPLAATDPQNDIYYYSLSGTGSDLFSVDGSGQITVSGLLDYETAGSYSLTATVSDMMGVLRHRHSHDQRGRRGGKPGVHRSLLYILGG